MIFTTSRGILSLVNPVLAEEEKEVEESKNMKNILQQKQESFLNNDKVEFAKKDKSYSDLDDNNCKSNKILKGASNKKDLKILSECEKATGKVKHVQEMPDGDYKFLLKLDKEYKSLLNKDNKKKTNGNLVVEIVPKDQDSKYVELPDKGDNVEVWGAWVIDKPKGWNEIHPAWKVIVN
ncbi:MAG TPA: hypothetical protein VFP49_03915 [Nitrososphaeraceae archaeon]|nr:hypothetical protein [Nitrososphaeraceae archaeon]